MTQGELGEVLGVSRGSISYYETQERVPDADFIIRAKRYFGVSTDYLLGQSELRNQKEVDDLLGKLIELDGIDVRQKSLLLFSLGFVSERLSLISDGELRENVVSWLAVLLQSYADMIYLPNPENIELDAMLLSSITQHHRDAIDCLSKLETAVMEELYSRLPKGEIRGCNSYAEIGRETDGNGKKTDE